LFIDEVSALIYHFNVFLPKWLLFIDEVSTPMYDVVLKNLLMQYVRFVSSKPEEFILYLFLGVNICMIVM